MARHPEWATLPIAKMLAEYGLNSHHQEEVSSCLKVETDQGLFRLKCFAYPALEFPFVFALAQYLVDRQFPYPEKIQPTIQGQPGIVEGGRFFYLATWQEGIVGFELDPKTLQEVGSLLGRLHYHSQGFVPTHPVHPARSQWGAWPGKLTDRYHDLEKFASLAKVGTTTFDRLFADEAPSFLVTAKGALQRLEGLLASYAKIVNQDHKANHVCHRDFIPHNLVKRPNGDLVLIDFDNAAYAERLDDLAKMLRYFSQWRLGKAKDLLAGYERWFPLSTEEIQLVQAFLRFPMEYWQLGRFAYERGYARHRALRRWIAASRDKEAFLVYLERVMS